MPIRLPELTIAQRLWLGLIVLLGFIAAADLISLRAARDVDKTLDELVRGGDERRGAGYEMRANLSAIVTHAHAYLRAGDQRQAALITKARRSFEDSLTQYAGAVRERPGQELTERVRNGYVALSGDIDRLIELERSRAARQSSWPALKREAESLLANERATEATGRGGASAAQAESGKAMRETLRDTTQLLQRHPPRRALENVTEAQKRFVSLVAQGRRLTRSRAETAWLDAAEHWHERASSTLMAHLAAVKVQEHALARLGERQIALDTLLADTVQPAARADLAAAVERASRTAHDAHATISRSLIVALLLGAAVAFATARAVRAPLRKVVASSRELAAGDFSRRVAWHSRDELGELADAFNRMAEGLQRTTVSRAYLEGVVNSMSEALFVVSDQGTVQTANPAARRLLGYEADELVGEPMHRLSDEAQQWLTALQGEQIIERPLMLQGKHGAPLPVLLSAVRLVIQGGGEPALVCIAQDQRARLAAEHHQRQTAVVFENTREALVLTDHTLQPSLVNPAFLHITGYSKQEAHGCHMLQLLTDARDVTMKAVHLALLASGQWQGELELRRKDGGTCPVWLNVSAVYDETGTVANYVFVLSDISEMKEVERKLDQLAHYDALTSLPNRRLFLERARLALDRALRSRLSVALLYLDLDDFKDVNDTFGHGEGDRLLREMAERLAGCLRSGDTLARLGGDEFVVMLENVEGQLEPSHVATKLLDAICIPYALGGIELRPRASIGISLGPSQGASVEELLKAADAAMYRAKHEGGAAFEFFSPELTHRAMQKLQIQNALRHPDLHAQLVVHYQPQLDLRSGAIVAAEALVRWNHPEDGLLLPGRFIAAAEDAGLISLIGECVLRTACREALAWQAQAPGLRVAVNVSAHQIKDERIVEAVRLVLEETALDPGLLELEVTEDALQVEDQAERVLRQLKRLGVRLALDDFGTGYSSLGSLKALPFDRLKIDRAFMRDVHNDSNGRSIVRAIIAMAHNLRLGVLAEGVETGTQLAFLRESHCDEAQGYLIGPPVAIEALRAQIAREPSLHAVNRHLSLIEGGQKSAMGLRG